MPSILKGFTQAINLCPFAFLETLKFPKTRKGFFHLINQPEIIQRASQELITKLLNKKRILQKIPNYPQSILHQIDNFIVNGIKRKAKTGFPDFSEYVVTHNGNRLEFVIEGMTGTTGDFYKACNRDEVINFVKDLGFISQDIYKENKGYKIGDNERLEYNGFKLNYFLDFKNIETEIGYTFSNTELNSKELIPIIYDSGGSHFFICCKKGDYYGKIFYDYIQSGYTIKELYYVADNIEEFLDSIIDEETYEKTSYAQ